MRQRILIALGAPNSMDGTLGTIAKNRLDLCHKTFLANDLILCTGGWGKHFNTSKKPHAFYAKAYLQKKGLSEPCFLEFALSSNTVDDAVKVKEIISRYPDPRLVVITSYFHLERAKLIFEAILEGYDLKCIGAQDDLPKNHLKKLIEHERKAIEYIIKYGLRY